MNEMPDIGRDKAAKLPTKRFRMNHVVDFIDKPFYQDNQQISARTARVSFISPTGIILKKEEFGYWDKEAVYTALREGREVCLDNLYIRDFTLNEVRRTDYDRVKLQNLSARHVFFDGNTDFSIAEFAGASTSFRDSVFHGTTVDFRDARFHCGELDFGKTELTLRNIYFNNAQFDHCPLDFGGMVVRSGDFHFYHVLCTASTLNFTSAHFSDGFKDFRKLTVTGSNLIFRSVFFNDGDTDFIEMRLDKGNIDFRLARFGSGELNFGGSILGEGDKDFSGVVFPRGMVSFTGARFGKGSLHMIDATFRKGNIHFNGCHFGCEDIHITSTDFGDGFLEFTESHFDSEIFNIVSCRFGRGDIDFNRSNLSRTALNFYGTEFSQGKLNFFDTIADSVTFHECTFDNHVYLNFEHCNFLSILNSIIEKTMDLRSNLALNTQKIKVINLSGTKNLGHIYIDWKDNRVRNMIYDQGSGTDFMDKASQFRLLKENFRNIGQYDDEDLAYVEFKRCQSQGRFRQEMVLLKNAESSHVSRLLRGLWIKLSKDVNWLLFDNVGRYGTSPSSVFKAMIQTILFFTLIYLSPWIELANLSAFHGSDNPSVNRVMLAFYQSVQTFLTIGYGGICPDNFTAVLLSGFEGFIGVFLMAYFTVSVVRKLLR